MSFFLIERHLLASLHRVVNLRANSVFTILALCLTLVCTSGINEPLTGKGIQKNDVCPPSAGGCFFVHSSSFLSFCRRICLSALYSSVCILFSFVLRYGNV